MEVAVINAIVWGLVILIIAFAMAGGGDLIKRYIDMKGRAAADNRKAAEANLEAARLNAGIAPSLKAGNSPYSSE